MEIISGSDNSRPNISSGWARLPTLCAVFSTSGCSKFSHCYGPKSVMFRRQCTPSPRSGDQATEFTVLFEKLVITLLRSTRSVTGAANILLNKTGPGPGVLFRRRLHTGRHETEAASLSCTEIDEIQLRCNTFQEAEHPRHSLKPGTREERERSRNSRRPLFTVALLESHT